jgi:hypothetical protein
MFSTRSVGTGLSRNARTDMRDFKASATLIKMILYVQLRHASGLHKARPPFVERSTIYNMVEQIFLNASRTCEANKFA